MAPAAPAFKINPDRLRKQVIYFTVTAQVVGLALELVVPAVKRKIFKKAKQIQSSRKDVDNKGASHDDDDERKFLESVRDQAELDVYDVNGDLREMTTQVSLLSNSIFLKCSLRFYVLVRLPGALFTHLAPHGSIFPCEQLDRAP